MCMFPACCFRQRTYVAQGLVNRVLNETWTHAHFQFEWTYIYIYITSPFVCALVYLVALDYGHQLYLLHHWNLNVHQQWKIYRLDFLQHLKIYNVCLERVCIYPTSQPWAEWDKFLCWAHIYFSFSYTSCLSKVKEPSLLYYFLISGREQMYLWLCQEHLRKVKCNRPCPGFKLW